MRCEDPERELLQPHHPTGVGVLLLAGSRGRVDLPRARVLQAHGAVVLAMRWFGGPGQQPGPYEVPIELFTTALDQLAPHVDDLAIAGTSFGGEAALVTATVDPRVTATIGFAASSVVWPGWNGHEWTSHWTWQGEPLPFVPLDPSWEPDADPPSFLPLYEHALDQQSADGAAIPVERIRGKLLLTAGGDDRVWPSVRFAERISERRRQHGLDTQVVTHPEAGHRLTLPGEHAATGGMTMARGGTPSADAALGTDAWPAIARLLGINA